MELLDRLNPTIAALSRAIEQEAPNSLEARRLMTHPGVGALTALVFVLIIGDAEMLSVREASGELSRIGAAGKVQRESATTRSHHQTRKFAVALPAGGSGPSYGAEPARLA